MSAIEVIVRASALQDERSLARVKDDLLRRIEREGDLRIAEVEQPSSDRLAAILILTGGVEREALKIVAKLPSPVLLIAHPSYNSLPAALEILARLRAAGGEGWETRLFPPGPGPRLGRLKLESSGGDFWGEDAEIWADPPPLEQLPIKGRASAAIIPSPRAKPFISTPPFSKSSRCLALPSLS